MKAKNVELSFLLCETSCMYSWLFNSLKPDEADKLLMILENQIVKDYGKYLQIQIVRIMYKDIESVIITPQGQIKVQKDKWKILFKALKEFTK